MKKIYFAGGVTIAALLAGCATNTVYDEPYNYDKGWRKGVVTNVGAGQEFTKQVAGECKYTADVSTNSQKYVIVRYWKNDLPKWRTMPIPIDSSLAQDDQVYVNINACDEPVVLRIKRSVSKPYNL